MSTYSAQKQSELSQFLRDIARTGHPLLRCLVHFNTRLAQRVRADSVPLLSSFLPVQGSFAAQRLEAVMPLALGREPEPWVLDFRQPSRRIALLPPDLLVRLARWYGLAAFREETGRVIGREAVTNLQRLVGEEGQLFALRRAELLTGNRVPVPDDPEGIRVTLPERIERAGRQAVLACLYGTMQPYSADAEKRIASSPPIPSSDADMETGRRLCIRLAPTLPPGFLEPVAALPPVLAVWPIVRKLVTKEIAPSWAPLFT